MANGGDANRFSTVGQLVDDPIRAHPQRIQATKFSAQRVPGEGVALQQAQHLLNRIDQRPAQLEQIAAGSSSENESCQRSAGVLPALGQLTVKLTESDGFVALDLGKSGL